MDYNKLPYEKRVKENIKNYGLDHLYPLETLMEYFKHLATISGAEFLLTDRHGEKMISLGDFRDFDGDVVENPGQKIRVCNRTVAHLYSKKDGHWLPEEDTVYQLLEETVKLLERMGEQTYLHTESSFYIDEIEEKEQLQRQIRSYSEKMDPLTGVFNQMYFQKRLSIVDRSEIIPVGIVNCNINDWKYVNDHFGEEQSDRLIRVVATLIREASRPEYVIGRVDGDVFVILLPMADEGEAEAFAEKLQKRCDAYEDTILSPSVACGVVYKTNVEEHLADLLSDAEYEMFQNKLEIKNSPDYRNRLEKKK